MKQITFIGYGKMAKSIISGIYDKYDIEVVGRDEKKLTNLKAEFPNIKIENIKNFQIDNKNILLAVKPYAIDDVAKELRGEAKIVISILAGIKIELLKKFFKSKSVIRVMPNIGATYNSSMSTLTGDVEYKQEVLTICNSFGNSLWLSSEKELDIATAIAGSGPAYLAIVAEALSDSGVRLGLKREDSQQITQGLFQSFSKLIMNEHPTFIKEAVMSPNGTTAEGCFELEKSNIRASFMKAIESAYKKALNI